MLKTRSAPRPACLSMVSGQAPRTCVGVTASLSGCSSGWALPAPQPPASVGDPERPSDVAFDGPGRQLTGASLGKHSRGVRSLGSAEAPPTRRCHRVPALLAAYLSSRQRVIYGVPGRKKMGHDQHPRGTLYCIQ